MSSTITVKISIEPRWTHDSHDGEIEIDERELDGMTPEDREAYIAQCVDDYVSNECPYGWQAVSKEVVSDCCGEPMRQEGSRWACISCGNVAEPVEIEKEADLS